MSIRYAVMVLTGINDESKMLNRVRRPSVYWEAFADAKAEAVACADELREYLESTDRRFEIRLASGEQRFEVRFAYGPSSRIPELPFQTVFDVCRCRVADVDRRHVER